MNPVLVMCLSLGYFFNLYHGPPARARGRRDDLHTPPVTREFHPVHHPAYIDFYEEVLADTTDPAEIESRYELAFAQDEWYRHLYRTSYAYHGAHPFYMWYWGAHALPAPRPRHLRRPATRRPAGAWGSAVPTRCADALEMAEDLVGRDPTITHLHVPPLLLADVT